jgi:hypothetical protein
MAQSTLHSSSKRSSSGGGRRARRRAAGLSGALAAAAAVSAAALLTLPEPATAFLPAGVNPLSSAARAASCLRRPRHSGWGATTLHDSEAYGPSPSSSSSSSSGSARAGTAAEQEANLQHALFKDDSRRVILFDGDCGFCSEGA